ncbi:hypothetical protein [Streptomyces sp. 4F14]|uniref:hypothetical protein n=1 Tax=Streptomyces sp. 4F14 TaxID=3394380 RepID=UPI003A89BCF4
MTLYTRTVALAVSAVLLAGGAMALAPAASAVASSSCSYRTGFTGTVDGNGVNYRTGPSTGFVSKGLLYDGDQVRISCGKGAWFYGSLAKRSKGGPAKGATGWIRSDMLYQLAG